MRVHEIARRIAQNGHDYHIISGSFEGCGRFAGNHDGYLQTFLGPSRKPACKAIEFAIAAWRQLPHLARDSDIVVEDFSPYAPVGAFRLRKKAEVVLQIQNYTGPAFLSRHGLPGVPLWAMERWYPRFFEHHILVGDNLRSRFRAPHSKVIPMGFTPDTRPPESQADRDYIAYLGRIDFHQKGLDLLLEALTGTDLPVRFAGAGREIDRLEERLRSLPACRFVGKLAGPEKWDFLRGARFVVMPSRFEGQPIVTIESAAAGTPLLVSPIPELDFVPSHEIGRQFPLFNPASLRKALSQMWDETTASPKKFEDATRRFAGTRDWSHLAAQFEDTLQQIVHEKALRAGSRSRA